MLKNKKYKNTFKKKINKSSARTKKKIKRKTSISKKQKAGTNTTDKKADEKEIVNKIPTENKIPTAEEIAARKKIKKFIKTSKWYLNIVCQNSGACMAFGTNISELNNFFSGFTDFRYVSSPIRKIGENTNNGIVTEIEYERNKYKAYAVLKTAIIKSSDNLAYEYVVGNKFINRIMKVFPCFVETYGLYYNKFEDAPEIISWKRKISKPSITLTESEELLASLSLQNSSDFKKACTESNKISILIQHIQNARSLQDMLTKKFIVTELAYVLFIVYQALSALRKTFTHYDLHTGNVLIYQPDPDKYIEYHYYETNDNIITFKSSCIPKIIDYGRSYFDNGNVTSKKIYDYLCTLPDCGEGDYACGYSSGFAYMQPLDPFFISTSQKNESHDLRLLKNISEIIKELDKGVKYKYISPDPELCGEPNCVISGGGESQMINTYDVWEPLIALKRFLRKVVYGIGIDEPAEKLFGTVENTQLSSDNIFNVEGAYIALKEIVVSQTFIDINNENNSQKTKLGDFHIYADQRPMYFEKV